MGLTYQKCVCTCGHMCTSYRPNEEKVIYYLLLTRKERQPSVEDEAKAAVGGQLGQWVQVHPASHVIHSIV